MVSISVLFNIYYYINYIKLDFTRIPSVFAALSFIIFPILSYYVYLNSNFNKWVALLFAFLTSVLCFIAGMFPLNFSKDLISWWNDLGTGIMVGLFVLSIFV